MKTIPRVHRRAGWYLALAAVHAGAASGAEIAVLTPAYSKRLDAEMDTDVASYFTFGLSEAARNTGERANKLNKLAAETAFDPERVAGLANLRRLRQFAGLEVPQA